ncbi:MAG: HicB family protein [Actinomycetia bacterium]|nr:HicB family protein [Actinomycetes bacterium]
MMKYKGYTGVIEIDEEAGILFGEVIGLRDVITFQGQSVAEAKASFEESLDFYLEICAKQGKPPEKPFSGKFLVRIAPELHRSLASEAQARHVSLNALIEQTLADNFAAVEPAPEDVPPAKPKARRKAANRETKSAASTAPKSAAKARPTPP